MGGVNVVSVSEYRLCEDREESKRILCGEDTLLRYSIQKKFPAFYIDLPSVHLRPNESPEYQFKRGTQFWDILKTNFFKVIARGVISFCPYLIKGYIKARYGKHPST